MAGPSQKGRKAGRVPRRGRRWCLGWRRGGQLRLCHNAALLYELPAPYCWPPAPIKLRRRRRNAVAARHPLRWLNRSPRYGNNLRAHPLPAEAMRRWGIDFRLRPPFRWSAARSPARST